MLTINDRIAWLVANNGKVKTKTDFSRLINISQPYLSQLCSSDRIPSDRTIADICREFGVDRIWLETGAGEPFRPADRNEQIAKVLAHAISGNDTARDRLIRAFSQLPDEMFDQAEKILEEVVTNLQKEKE